jgi:hypothetical protein
MGKLEDDLRFVRFELAMKHAKDEANVAADLIFGTLAPSCPWFVALVLELNAEDGEDFVYEYLRSQHIDIFGKTTYAGQSVDRRTSKHYDPCSDIFRNFKNDGMLSHY